MRRRRYMAALSGWLGLAGTAGCLGLRPVDTGFEPTYPGGTLVIENTGDEALAVSVTVDEDRFSAALSTTVEPGRTHVERSFVMGTRGTIATLRAHIGESGEPTTFEFLPGGGDGTQPEVAHLTITTEVEESARWVATRGTQ